MNGSGTAQEETGRGEKLAQYVASFGSRQSPAHIIASAKVALIDFIGVAVGAVDEPAARATRAVAESWAAPGRARIFRGGLTNPAMAALVNGTMAHCMDYDDTHIGGSGHIAAPVMSTALAIGQSQDAEGSAVLEGFITGYEVMARLGNGGIKGIGRNLQQRGFHPTSINGVTGAAAVSAAMRGYDARMTTNALGAAATTASGFVGSFGTDAKPFHAGHAAMDGILAADLAAQGMVAAHGLFERHKGMLDALIQDRSAEFPVIDFADGWELLNNGYKPFACCRATHASIQAAHQLTARIAGRPVARARTKVHWSAPFSAGKLDPQTPLECKFSVAFCVAAALCGYDMTAAAFNDATLRDPAVRAILPRVELAPQRDQPQFEAYLDVWLEDGTYLQAETQHFLGHPTSPMSSEHHRRKFMSLVVPVLGEDRAESLIAALTLFERPGAMAEAMNLLAG